MNGRVAGWFARVRGYVQEGQTGGKKTGQVDGGMDWWKDRCENGRNRQNERINGKLYGQEEKLGDDRNG